MANGLVQQFLHRSRQKVPILYSGCPFPKNCPYPWRDLEPHPPHDSLGPSEPITQTASRSVQPFLHRRPQGVPILYNGMPISPLKIAHSHRGSGPPSNTWAHPSPQPNRHLDWCSRFCRAHSVTIDQPTDRTRQKKVQLRRIGSFTRAFQRAIN